MEINLTYLIVGVPSLIIGAVAATAKIVNGGSSKHGKIYDRIEEIEKAADEKYPSQKLCDERSGNMGKKLDSIEGKVDKLLMKNGLHEN